MQRAFGAAGSRWIALGIAISALGFLSQSILTAPRVYFAMARDGLFFRSVGWLDPRHGVPSVAILLQAVMAIVIALSGRYDQRLSYVVSMDSLSGPTAASLFVFRRRDRASGRGASALARVPGHPVTTGLFVAVVWLVVINTIASIRSTRRSVSHLLAGIPSISPGTGFGHGHVGPRLAADRLTWSGPSPSPARFNLATSGLSNFPLSALPPGSLEDLEINGPTIYGTRRCRTHRPEDRGACRPAVAAAGTSMANHLALAALWSRRRVSPSIRPTSSALHRLLPRGVPPALSRRADDLPADPESRASVRPRGWSSSRTSTTVSVRRTGALWRVGEMRGRGGPGPGDEVYLECLGCRSAFSSESP
jgi:hypothetical protein